MKRKKKRFRRLNCYLFHKPQLADLAFFTDVISNDVASKYYCPICDEYFLSTSKNSTFRVFMESENNTKTT